MNAKFNVEQLEDAEQELLAADNSTIPAAPERRRLLAAAYTTTEASTKETKMIPNPIARLFAGKHPALRLALGSALLLAVLGLSMVFPRPAPPAWASAEGYMLAFDFGEGSTQEQVQPILDQLHAAIRAFKEAHNLPLEHPQRFSTHGEKRVIKRIEKHSDGSGSETSEEKSRVVAMIALPDASLLEDLKAALAGIAGLPEPQPTNATWFTEQGLPDPDKPGIHLALSFDAKGGTPHMFYFPETATEAEVEASINDWLSQNKPDFKGKVDVTLKRDGENLELSVKIEEREAVETVDIKGPATDQ